MTKLGVRGHVPFLIDLSPKPTKKTHYLLVIVHLYSTPIRGAHWDVAFAFQTLISADDFIRGNFD